MIRLLVLDVDGTMTDGGVYYDATGNELKKFAIKDDYLKYQASILRMAPNQ
jgi:3-deoxy-D-manno-octulosonate 8-phosphate phosphatase KdsC-like HAD superfamily phosphatase